MTPLKKVMGLRPQFKVRKTGGAWYITSNPRNTEIALAIATPHTLDYNYCLKTLSKPQVILITVY